MKEKEAGLGRRIEVKVEKVGGGVLTLLGVLSFKFPVVALGIGLFIIGKVREPVK